MKQSLRNDETFQQYFSDLTFDLDETLRLLGDPNAGEVQEITFAWTQQAVDTIKHICLALDELVADRVERISDLVSE